MLTKFTKKEAVKLLLTEAAPFLLTRFLEVGYDFAAMIMLANLGEHELAASALISSLQAFLRGVPATNLYSVGILSGAAIGEARQKEKESDATSAAIKNEEVGYLYRAGLKLALISAPIPILISLFISKILQVSGQSKINSDLSQDYFRAYAATFFPSFIFVVNQQIAQASSRPWTVVGFTALNRLISFAATAFLVYQANMGVRGLGYGYAIGAIASTTAFTLHLRCHGKFSTYALFNFKPQPSIPSIPTVPKPYIKNLLNTGLPIAGYAVAELGSIVFLALLLGSLSKSFLKTAQPSMQYTSFLANLTFAFGQGAGILVSKMYGEKENLKAQQIGDLSIILGLILPAIFLVLSMVIPNELNSVFINTKDAKQASEAAWFLIAGFATQIFDALRNMASGANRGLAKYIGPVMTRAPMLQNIFGILCINIPISLGLAYGTFLTGKGPFIGRAASITISSAMILDTWLKTKTRPTDNKPDASKLGLAQVFCPRILKIGRLPEPGQSEATPLLPSIN